jgi:hypothetical protein
MAPAALVQSEMPLEVHLPQIIGPLRLEALPRAGRRRGMRQQAVATQDGRDGAGGRDGVMTLVLEAAPELASSPGRMRLAQGHDGFDQGSFGLAGRASGPTRAVATGRDRRRPESGRATCSRWEH